MQAFWTKARLLFLVAVVLFSVYGAAAAGWAFDPLEHAEAFLGFGLAFLGGGLILRG